jgi:site-specific DNA-cytosine methylase
MKHFGDITKIHGYDVPPVDIITGGSPCQDLSVAGKRAGLAGERSGLFMDQIRIVKEMRDESKRRLSIRGADYDIRYIKPRYMVWENVAGAFSSGNPKGADFQAVLEEICKVVCKDVPPIPIPKEGWHYAGNLDGVGDDGTPFSVSWRLHNAQWWGVPQRRRRVCVVADFGGNTASKLLFELWGKTEQSNTDIPIADFRNESEPEVQFERQSVSGNIKESGNEGEGVTGTSENNIGETISFQERAGKPGGVKASSYNESEQERCQPSITNPSSIQSDRGRKKI